MGVLKRGFGNAFRSSVRAASISIILALSIGLALAMLLANQAIKDKVADLKTSVGTTLEVRAAGAFNFQGGGEPLKEEYAETIRKLAHVTGTYRILDLQAGDGLIRVGEEPESKTSLKSSIDAGTLGRRFQGVDSAGGSSAATPVAPPVVFFGIDGDLDERGNKIRLTSGTLFSKGDANEAVVGKDLAAKNNLAIGSTFEAYGATLKVVGIFDAGNKFQNDSVKIPFQTAQRIGDMKGEVGTILVKVDSIENLESVKSEISAKLGSDKVDVTSPQQGMIDAIASLRSIESVSLFSFIGSIVAAASILFLSMVMIVRERRREIGVLKAIGAPTRTVIAQFGVESLVFTLIGTALGLVLAVLSSNGIIKALVATKKGDSNPTGPVGFESPGGGDGPITITFGGPDEGAAKAFENIAAVVQMDLVLYAIAAALTIGVIGSIVPAWLISKVRPAEAMRGE